MMKEEEQSQPLPQATRERILGIAMVAETLVVLVASFLFVSQEQGVHDVFSLISQNYFWIILGIGIICLYPSFELLVLRKPHLIMSRSFLLISVLLVLIFFDAAMFLLISVAFNYGGRALIAHKI